jgi:hypothetical protein
MTSSISNTHTQRSGRLFVNETPMGKATEDFTENMKNVFLYQNIKTFLEKTMDSKTLGKVLTHAEDSETHSIEFSNHSNLYTRVTLYKHNEQGNANTIAEMPIDDFAKHINEHYKNKPTDIYTPQTRTLISNEMRIKDWRW